MTANNSHLDKMLHIIKEINRRNAKVVFLTGAGVSASCGIPTYRGTDGIYTKLKNINIPELNEPEDLFRRSVREKYPEVFDREDIKEILKSSKDRKHGISHNLPLILLKAGIDVKVITQNIDGLYIKAGLISGENLIEFHGSNTTNIMLYDDVIDDNTAELAYEWTKMATVIIVMGTSLQVKPFAALPNVPSKTCLRILVDTNPSSHKNNMWTKHGTKYEYTSEYGMSKCTFVEFPGKHKVTLRTEWGSKSNSRKYKRSYIFNSDCDTWCKQLIAALSY